MKVAHQKNEKDQPIMKIALRAGLKTW